MLLTLGRAAMTCGVADWIKSDPNAHLFVASSLFRHSRCDYGDVCAEDKALNDEALVVGGRVLSAYKHDDGTRIWIITEGLEAGGRLLPDGYTTVLFPDEY